MPGKLDVACLVAIKTLTGVGLSATAAGQIVQRLQREPETALTWRRTTKRRRIVADGYRSDLVTKGFPFVTQS